MKRTAIRRHSKAVYPKLMKKAVESFNRYIRTYYRKIYGNVCPFCKVNPIEHCFHFITAVFLNTRFDTRNVIGSCAGCNYNNEHYPHTYMTWFLDYRGRDEWDELMVAAKKQIKLGREDLRGIAKEYDGKLADLEA